MLIFQENGLKRATTNLPSLLFSPIVSRFVWKKWRKSIVTRILSVGGLAFGNMAWRSAVRTRNPAHMSCVI